MSSQGTASNANGHAFEDECERVVAKSGVFYEREVRRYRALGPGLDRHDFVIGFPGNRKSVVLECKYVSPIPGSIWQKIPYAIDMLAEIRRQHGVGVALVLGGDVGDWRFRYIASRCHVADVRLVTLDNLGRWLEVWKRGE